MPDHDGLLHTAHLQGGYVTVRQAAAHGFSRRLCHHYCRKGSWLHVARSLYRVHAVPAHPDEDFARTYFLARDSEGRPAGVLSHGTALYLHGLVDRRPAQVQLSLDPASRAAEPAGALVFYRRVDLPWRIDGMLARAAREFATEASTGTAIVQRPWAEPWAAPAGASGPARGGRHPALQAEEIEDRGRFRLTAPLRSILDAQAWRTEQDLSDAIERGLRRDLFEVDACLEGLETMLPLQGRRAMYELLRAVRARSRRVERDLRAIRLRIASVQHDAERRRGVPRPELEVDADGLHDVHLDTPLYEPLDKPVDKPVDEHADGPDA